MDEVQRRVKEGAEVVFVVRDCRDPQKKSEVFLLDHASPALVDRLTSQAQGVEPLHKTSLEMPRPKQPILEWDATRGYLHQQPLPPAASPRS